MTTHTIQGLRLALMLMGIGLMGACKKDNSGSGNTSSKVSLLTSGTWTFQSYNDKNGSGQWVNDDPSAIHFQVNFGSNGTVTEVGNSTIGQWQANSGFTALTVSGTDANGSFTVNSIGSSSLQIVNTVTGELWIYSK